MLVVCRMDDERLRAIVAAVEAAARDGEFCKECGFMTAIGCHRASMTFGLETAVLSTFHEAYVAEYQRSMRLGERLNRMVVDALTPRVLAAPGAAAIDPAWILRSLQGEQAKVWPSDAELEEEPCNATTLELKGAWINDASGQVWFNAAKASRSLLIQRDGRA